MTISFTGRARVSRRGRRSKGESAQLLMTPSSAQTLHCHRIGAGGSVRSTIIRPEQEGEAGQVGAQFGEIVALGADEAPE